MGGAGVVVQADELKTFCIKILEKIEVDAADAQVLADSLVEADLRGIASHGVARLPSYCKRFRQGLVRKKAEFRLLKETAATALVDARGSLGQVVAVESMRLAIRKARAAGAGVVGVRNSTHLGALAYYSTIAANENMVGLVATNGSPRMAPWGGVTRLLGVNPWSIAIPAEDQPIVLDISNSNVAYGKIRLAAKKGERIPPTWAMTKNGEPTTDPNEALGGVLLPMGDHKGYAISVVIELLAAAMTGANMGPEVGPLDDLSRPQGVGHLLAAIDVQAFIPLEEFKSRCNRLARILRSSEPIDPSRRILLPGEPEETLRRDQLRGGIRLSSTVASELAELARELDVSFPCLS